MTALTALVFGFLGAAIWSYAGLADNRTRAFLLDNPDMLPQMVEAYEPVERDPRPAAEPVADGPEAVELAGGEVEILGGIVANDPLCPIGQADMALLHETGANPARAKALAEQNLLQLHRGESYAIRPYARWITDARLRAAKLRTECRPKPSCLWPSRNFSIHISCKDRKSVV